MALVDWLNGDLFDALRDKFNAVKAILVGGTVDQVLRSTAGSDPAYGNSILPASGVANLKIAKIDIGDWNMDSTASVSINTNIERDNMVSVHAIIRPDASDSYMPLNVVMGAVGTICGGVDNETTDSSAMFVKLSRTTSGHFDSTAYDSTGYNRGFIIIIYEG